MDIHHGKIPRQALGIAHDGIHAASGGHAEAQDHDQRHRHDDGLDEIRERGCQETAHDRVDHDHRGRDQHSRHIVHAEQSRKQLSAGRKAGGGIRDKEYDDHNCRDGREQITLISPPLGEKLGHRNGVKPGGVAADAARHDEPVQIRAHCKADGRPSGLRQAGQIRHTRQAHQKPAAHIRGLGAHGGNEGPQLASAQIEVIHRVVLFRKPYADTQHGSQVNDNGQHDANLCARHCDSLSLFANSRYLTTLFTRTKYRTEYRIYSILRLDIFKIFLYISINKQLYDYPESIEIFFKYFLSSVAFQELRRHAVRVGHQRIFPAGQAPVV